MNEPTVLKYQGKDYCEGLNWQEISKDTRPKTKIAEELGINRHTLSKYLKKNNLVKVRNFFGGKYSKIQKHYCKKCGEEISRGSELCGHCASIGKNFGKKFPNRSGKHHHNWKKNPTWYREKIMREHPNANKRGRVFEHRLIVEEFIGRRLKREEVVHHIDMKKSNNSINNLMIFKNNGEHLKFHIYFDKYGFNQRVRRMIAERWKDYKKMSLLKNKTNI